MQMRDVTAFVYDVVYALPGAAIGFKLFYEHCREVDRIGLWRRLASDAELKVVHLTRNAAFDLYLSLLYAQRTDQWLIRRDDTDAAPNDSVDIEVDVEHCRKFLQGHLDRRREAVAQFRSHPLMDVDYSELETDLGAALSRIRQFTGAPSPKEDPVPLRKQARRQARDKVRNYDELVRSFRGTSLAHMFDAQ